MRDRVAGSNAAVTVIWQVPVVLRVLFIVFGLTGARERNFYPKKCQMWLLIILARVSIVVNDVESSGVSIDDAVNATEFGSSTGVYPDVVNLSVVAGFVATVDLGQMCNKYPALESFESSGDVQYESDMVTPISFAHCAKLKYLSIQSVTEVGTMVCSQSMSLVSVSLPEAVHIETAAFYGCCSLVDVNVPKLVEAKSQIFANCGNLSRISLPLCVIPSGAVFAGCEKLVDVDMPLMVRITTGMFENCHMLQRLELPSIKCIETGAFKNSGVETLIFDGVVETQSFAMSDLMCLRNVKLASLEVVAKGCFMFCQNLTNVELPNVQDIGVWGFQSCIRFTFHTFPNLRHISESAFDGCTGVRSLSDNKLPNVTSIGPSAFMDCRSIESVYLTCVVSIDALSFAKCVNLALVRLPQLVTAGEGSFRYCSSIRYMFTDYEDVPKYYFSETDAIRNFQVERAINIGSYAFYRCSTLETVYCPNVKRIRRSAFQECPNLREVVIPIANSLEGYCFQYCSNLTQVTMFSNQSKYNEVLIMEGAFQHCTSLEYLVCPNVISVGGRAFDSSGCVEIKLPACRKIGEYAFLNSPVEIVELPAVTDIGPGAFIICEHLHTLCCSNATMASSSMCYGCISLVNFTGPAVKTLAEKAFYKCKDLAVFDAGTKISEVHDRCFYDCISLKEMHLPAMAILEGDHQFHGCSNLTYISMEKLMYAQESARWTFAGCLSLVRIDMPEHPPRSFHKLVFVSTGIPMENGVIPITLCLASSTHYDNYDEGKGAWKYLSASVPANYLSVCSNYSHVPLPDQNHIITWLAVGISCGVVVLVVVVSVAVVFLIRRREKRELETKLYLTSRVIDDFG